MFLNKVLVIAMFFLFTIMFSQKKRKDTIVNKLDEVIVTATTTKRQLSSLPMPVTLITQKDIKKTSATRLRDIIVEQTGIILVSDFGSSEGVQIQGMDAEYTLILVNGLPYIGRTSGNLDLNRISVNNIKQIEIVKGPSSSLYGSEALGGVINIITEIPKSEQTNSELSYAGRFGAEEELDLSFEITHQKDKLGIESRINLNSGSGYDVSPETENNTVNPYQNYNGNLRLTYDISDQLKFVADGRYFNQKVFNSDSKAEQKDYGLSTKLTHWINEKNKIDFSFYTTRFKTESQFDGNTSVFNQTLLRPEIKGQFKIKSSDLIVGVGGNFDALERTFFDGKEQYNSQYVFTQYDTKIKDKVNLILGLRYDHFNTFKSAISPKISAIYKFNTWLSTKASVGLGYKVPDFRQLFFNFRNTAGGYVVLGTEVLHELYGNLSSVSNLSKELAPESSIGYNLGFDFKPFKNLSLHLNFFRNDISDLINTFVVDTNFPDLPNTTVFSYENRAKVFTQGLEFNGSYKINTNFNITFGYQFLDTGDKEEINKIKSGEVFFRRSPSSPSEIIQLDNYFGLANRSRHTGNIKLFYKNFDHNFSLNARILYRSKYALFDTNNSGGIIDEFDQFASPNTQINIGGSLKLLNIFTFQFGIDNLFNNTEQENKASFENIDAVLQLGRTFYTRIQFNF